jgi:hypothetical protein
MRSPSVLDDVRFDACRVRTAARSPVSRGVFLRCKRVDDRLPRHPKIAWQNELGPEVDEERAISTSCAHSWSTGRSCALISVRSTVE